MTDVTAWMLFDALLEEWVARHHAICNYGNSDIYCARVASGVACLHPPPNALVDYVKANGDERTRAFLNIHPDAPLPTDDNDETGVQS